MNNPLTITDWLLDQAGRAAEITSVKNIQFIVFHLTV